MSSGKPQRRFTRFTGVEPLVMRRDWIENIKWRSFIDNIAKGWADWNKPWTTGLEFKIQNIVSLVSFIRGIEQIFHNSSKVDWPNSKLIGKRFCTLKFVILTRCYGQEYSFIMSWLVFFISSECLNCWRKINLLTRDMILPEPTYSLKKSLPDLLLLAVKHLFWGFLI